MLRDVLQPLQPTEPTTGTGIAFEAQTQVGQNTIGTVFEAQTAVAPRGTRSYGAVTTRMVETLK